MLLTARLTRIEDILGLISRLVLSSGLYEEGIDSEKA